MKPTLNLKSTTFLFFFISLVLLAVANNLAVQFSLYWQYLWFDIPMHFLGGTVIALGFLSAYPMHFSTRGRRFKATLVFVLVGGLLWEAFEHSAGISLTREAALLPDTALDLAMDIVGGVVAFYVVEHMRVLDAPETPGEDTESKQEAI